ncbi:MAG: GNAT family N-acetyltransferase [Clostridia bacterium]|nr:GNAT family N-acetyltransferase [Clostridia bacterium]
MSITIEIPKMKDFNRVNKLAKQVHELHVNWRPDLFLSVDEVISKECFEKMIQNKEIFVAKIQDEIIGYITFNIKEKNNPSMRYRKQLQIEAICVDEKNRGKGIGTALLNYTKEHGKANNCTDIYLTVNEENKKAIKVYEEFGFKVKSIAYSMLI